MPALDNWHLSRAITRLRVAAEAQGARGLDFAVAHIEQLAADLEQRAERRSGPATTVGPVVGDGVEP